MLLLVFQGCTYVDKINPYQNIGSFPKNYLFHGLWTPKRGNYPHILFHRSCSQALTNHCVMYCRHRMDNIIPRLDVATGDSSVTGTGDSCGNMWKKTGMLK